jgi:hypothetical protein
MVAWSSLANWKLPGNEAEVSRDHGRAVVREGVLLLLHDIERRDQR